mmetsp:Transcript_27898/g.70074  ORF Transcript_27898/g.70074 Transcript_27898/m.70074 type:complete len:585 (-) Transcript_27898:283-2037(-)|eukprot:CAMPEP_0181371586 /NCGR_PEP_ID=MMETSP1106-20121128/14185_1 /TAXON_ID=81844 /ORGANISM="Mantoniella antarctica, Strain SL-175" /LENGTH=584 /DNA_ID=CAMNT_0023488749 /DNA_START=171 /DNA_END=1925 /DNA_ORIENTATION=-
MTTQAEVAPVVDAVPAAEADGEVSPADAKVVDPAPTETPAVTAAAPAKVVPKPDKPRTAKPDRTELEATIVILQEACDVNQARIEELKRKIETKRDSRKTINAGTQGTRARITELNGSFTAHMDTRNAIRKELIAVDSIRERMKEQVLAMKQKLKFFTVEAIDREISKLEEHHAHTSMPLQEEKKIMTQLKDLSRSRETVREYNDAQAKISGEDGNRKAIIERIRAKDLEINAVKAEQQQYRATLDAVRSKEEKAGADIPQMQEERNASYEIIKAKRDEIRRLRTEFKATEDEYWTTEQLWRAYLKVEKQKQWEATVEERKARDEARKQWEIENAPEPFEAEVAAAEQLIAYLAKWDPKSNKAAEEKAAEEAAAVAAKRADAFKGLKIMNKKMLDEPEEDDLFSLSGTSKGKKAKKKQRVAAEEPQGPNPKERLNISFDAYAHFSKLSLTAPSLVGEVPAMMNSLKEKKELFLEKRKIKKERIAAGLDVEDERKEKEEREAAAAAKREKRESNKKGKDKKEKGAEPDAEAEGAAEADVDQITVVDAEGGGKDAEGPTVTVSLEAVEDGVKVTLSTEKEAEAKEE